MEAKTLYKQSVVYLKDGDPAKALSILEEAINLPSSTKIAGPIHYNIAVCNQRLGNSDKALDALRKAVGENSWLAAEARKDSDFKDLRKNQEFVDIFNGRNPVLTILISWICAVSLFIGLVLGIRYFIRHQGYEGIQAIGLPAINGLAISVPLVIGAPSVIYWLVHLLIGPAVGIYFFRWLQDKRARKVHKPSMA